MNQGNDNTGALAADQIDEAARRLGEADVMLGDPDFNRPEVERLLLDALKFTLNALALLRGQPGRNVTPE